MHHEAQHENRCLIPKPHICTSSRQTLPELFLLCVKAPCWVRRLLRHTHIPCGKTEEKKQQFHADKATRQGCYLRACLVLQVRNGSHIVRQAAALAGFSLGQAHSDLLVLPLEGGQGLLSLGQLLLQPVASLHGRLGSCLHDGTSLITRRT